MAKTTTTRKKRSAVEGAHELPPPRIQPVIFPIRMSQATVDRLREVADRKGIPASTLARMWILEHLADEPSKHSDWV